LPSPTQVEATVKSESAVLKISEPGLAILRVFRCVLANMRAWGINERQDWRHREALNPLTPRLFVCSWQKAVKPASAGLV